MGMKKLTEGRGDILNKHGKRKEHHALKIHVTSNFPQRSRDIEARRNSTKGLSLFDTSRKLQSTCFSPHPPPPPPAIKKSTFRKTSNNNESRLLSRARGVSRRGMERRLHSQATLAQTYWSSGHLHCREISILSEFFSEHYSCVSRYSSMEQE